MATCKDCIHHDLCKEQEKLMLTIDNIFELQYQNGVEKSCPQFKNKADFVEVEKVAEMLAEQCGDYPCNLNDNAEWLCLIDCDCKCSMKCWEKFVKHYGEKK